MMQPSTSNDTKDQTGEARRPWQFGLKHWFAFSAAVVFFLGAYIRFYPSSEMIVPALAMLCFVLVVLRIAVYPRRPRVFAVTTTVLIVIYVVGGVLLSHVVVREPVRRVLCRSNLKQIMLAMHNYHAVYGCFPPAYIPDANGRPMHSWRTLLLPYVEQQALHRQYRWDEPWDGPNNRALWSVRVPQYECPEQPRSGSPMTSYVAVVGPETAWPGATPVKLSDFRDGGSNTIMVVETANSDIHWMEPRDLDFASLPLAVCPEQGGGISSLHRETSWRAPLLGAHAGMANGTVRLLPPTMSAAELRALLTRAGGEATDGDRATP